MDAFRELPDISLSLPASEVDMIEEFHLDNDNILMSWCSTEVENLLKESAGGTTEMNAELKKPAYVELPSPSMPPSKRFSKTNEEEMETLFSERQSKNTKKNTAWGLRIFQDWNTENRDHPMDTNTVPVEELAIALRQFYTEARPKSQENPAEKEHFYHRNTLINIRGAINRHLSDIHRNIDIIRDKEFRYANGLLDGLLKVRAKSGKSKPTNHKPIIEKSDLEKNFTYLSKASNNPIILRHNVWYNLSIHFVTRGMEFHHQLSRDSFTFHNNDEYVSINHCTQQKNYQGGINSDEAPIDKRLYSSGTASCPVKMLQLLISQSDTADGPCALFTQYKRNAFESPQTHTTWYTRKLLSKRTFANFLSEICKSAGVSKNYTPHCLRATSVQFLNDRGHETRHIMYMSAHKNEASLRSYTRNVSVEQEKALSSSLQTENPAGALVRFQSDSAAVSSSSTNKTSLGISESDPQKISTTQPQPTQITFQSTNSMQSHPGYFTNATFNGCTLNFTH